MSRRFDDSIYQTGYSRQFALYQYDESLQRLKAGKTLAVITDFLGGEDSTRQLRLLDIGCSAGMMTRLYAERFSFTLGIDIDGPAVEYAMSHFADDHLQFRVADGMYTECDDDSFHVVTCSHIYEHVPDSDKLMNEIYRILKPDGICYFVAQNRLTLIEPHYFLPFLSILPKNMAHIYFRLSGKGDHYYEKLLTLGGLKKLTSRFKVVDYTRRIIAEPEGFSATELLSSGTFKQKIALKILDIAYFLCPTYVWILKKEKRD